MRKRRRSKSKERPMGSMGHAKKIEDSVRPLFEKTKHRLWSHGAEAAWSEGKLRAKGERQRKQKGEERLTVNEFSPSVINVPEVKRFRGGALYESLKSKCTQGAGQRSQGNRGFP